jgi:hypothetical protein
LNEDKYATTWNIASILRGEETKKTKIFHGRRIVHGGDRRCRRHGWKVARRANVGDTQIHGDKVALAIADVVSGKTMETARKKPIRHYSR